MGEKELAAALAGERPASQLDWDVKAMGRWVVITIASATHDPLYPLTTGQAKALARAILASRSTDKPRREMKVGYKYTPPKAGHLRMLSHGTLELTGGKTHTGFHIPSVCLAELARMLLNAAYAVNKFKTGHGPSATE